MAFGRLYFSPEPANIEAVRDYLTRASDMASRLLAEAGLHGWPTATRGRPACGTEVMVWQGGDGVRGLRTSERAWTYGLDHLADLSRLCLLIWRSDDRNRFTQEPQLIVIDYQNPGQAGGVGSVAWSAALTGFDVWDLDEQLARVEELLDDVATKVELHSGVLGVSGWDRPEVDQGFDSAASYGPGVGHLVPGCHRVTYLSDSLRGQVAREIDALSADGVIGVRQLPGNRGVVVTCNNRDWSKPPETWCDALEPFRAETAAERAEMLQYHRPLPPDKLFIDPMTAMRGVAGILGMPVDESMGRHELEELIWNFDPRPGSHDDVLELPTDGPIAVQLVGEFDADPLDFTLELTRPLGSDELAELTRWINVAARRESEDDDDHVSNWSGAQACWLPSNGAPTVMWYFDAAVASASTIRRLIDATLKQVIVAELPAVRLLVGHTDQA